MNAVSYAKIIILLLAVSHVLAQNALDLDGTNDYISSSNPGPTGTSDRTVEAWIKTSTSISTQKVLIDWGTFATGQRFTLNIIDFGKLRIEVSGSGFNSTSSIADGLWHHVAVTYDHSATTKFNMYIDGVLHLSQNIVTSVNTGSTNGIIIGRRVDGVNYYDGTIDEVRIWNVVRTANEISNNMNKELCSAEPGLVAYYNFNQGIAGMSNTGVTTLNNLIGSNNGTLNNFGLSGSSSNWVAGKSLTSGMTLVSSSEFACDSLVSPSGNHVWYSTAQVFDTLSRANGCDSVLSVDLTVGNTTEQSLAVDVCDFYEAPSGKIVWLTSGIYSDTLLNPNGCDTVLTIDLSIINLDTTVTQLASMLTSNESNATYQWMDCSDSSLLVGDTNQNFQPAANGNYAVIISNGICMDTSACINMSNVGIESDETMKEISVFPNPTTGLLNVNMSMVIQRASVIVRSVSGEMVQQIQVEGENDFFQLNQRPGLYLVEIHTSDKVYFRKIILQ